MEYIESYRAEVDRLHAQRDLYRGALERVGLLAIWLHRDRREPDKVLAYSQELTQLARHLPLSLHEESS
jgi:hypothetical protein